MSYTSAEVLADAAAHSMNQFSHVRLDITIQFFAINVIPSLA